MGTEGQEQTIVPLGLWIVDAERGFVGGAPPPELSSAALELARRASSSGGVHTIDVPLVAERGGEPVTVRLVARPAGGALVAVASHPLSTAVQVEEALSRFELVMRATHEAVWDWSVATGPWWNRQHYEMLGYDPRSTPPSLDAWQRRIHPDDRERVQRQLEESLASGAALWQCEYRFLRGEGGDVRVALDRGCIQRDEQGRLLRMAGVLTDITAEREATAALRASEERFREMTTAIDHFFWVTNPEGTKAFYVSPAYEKIWGRSVESVYRDATSVVDGIHEDDRERVKARLHLKVEGSYDETYRIRRPDGTIAWIRSRAFPIRDADGQVVRLAGIAMDITAQLEQVLVNLVLNARDAMPHGGRLGIETRNVSIGLPGSDPAWRRAELDPGDYVALAVSDTGIGIPSDVLPHLFEPFFTTKPTGHGTGLGLATCYGIAQQAGGVILVDTQIGAGTTFTLLLPRAQPEQTKPISWYPKGSVSGGTETLLFVEDDPGVRRVGMQILAAHDYSVLTAGSGAEALEMVAAHPAGIQLLVTDVVMPNMSGPELARRLRAAQPQLRVLYCSGYTEDAVVRQSGPEARTGFLSKPYTRETLLERVRALLDADD